MTEAGTREARSQKEIRPEKVQAVQEIKEKFEKAKIVIFTSYQAEEGLPVREVQKLRKKLRESKGEFKVVKNTLARKALKELKLENLSDYFKGSTAVAFGYDDAIMAAKALFDFSQEQKKGKEETGLPAIRGAWYDAAILDLKQVRFLATLPPKPVLLAQLFGTMKAPITGLATVLSGTLRGLVTVLDGIRKQKETRI